MFIKQCTKKANLNITKINSKLQDKTSKVTNADQKV